jgi:hypothetical protein
MFSQTWRIARSRTEGALPGGCHRVQDRSQRARCRGGSQGPPPPAGPARASTAARPRAARGAGTERAGEKRRNLNHVRAAAACALRPVKEDSATHRTNAIALCSVDVETTIRSCPRWSSIDHSAQRAVLDDTLIAPRIPTVVHSRPER